MHQEYDHEFWVCANKEWWERLGLREEVDRLEKSLNNRRIRKHSGEDKLQWGYYPKVYFTMKEAYDLLKEVDI